MPTAAYYSTVGNGAGNPGPRNGKHAYYVAQLENQKKKKIEYHTYGIGLRFEMARGKRAGGKSIIIMFKNNLFQEISTHSDHHFLEDVRVLFTETESTEL